MSEFLVLAVIIIAVLVFFNREKLKNRFFPDKKKNYTLDDRFNEDKREREKKLTGFLAR